MLKTCLKHDLKAVMRLWWIIGASMLGASLVFAIGFRFFLQANLSDWDEGLRTLSIFGMMGSMVSIFVLAAGFTLTFILIYWRMYTHFYTDQGYLTFTLPIKRSTLYLSKVITGTIVELSTFAMLFIGILLMCLIIPPSKSGALLDLSVFRVMGDFLRLSWEGVGPWMILWILLGIALLVCIQLATSGLTYLCITIGAVVAKKHKLLAGIGIYYLVNMAVSLVGQFISLFLTGGIVGTLVGGIVAGKLVGCTTITAILLVCCLAAGCLAALYHFITLGKLEKQLNLA